MSRSFSRPVSEQLTKVLADYDPQSTESDEAVRLAVVRAVAEARSQLWQPEEVVAALHAAVSEAMAPGLQESLRALLKLRALVAYFGAQESGF